MNRFSLEAYDKLLKRLLSESSSQGEYISLERAQKLSLLLGNPEKNYQVIHIAGTNGKGSTATKITAALEMGGYKTALYTSPHIFSFTERMKINGLPIEKEALFSILTKIYDVIEKNEVKPTFFELATFLAFSWFSEEKVDVAVVEVGLGGALDATNVVTPLLSVITSIALDHTDRLGSTEEAIASQKAGIIKQGVPVVLGPKANRFSIRQRAEALSSSVMLAPELQGWYDLENQSIAETALIYLEKFFPRIKPRDKNALARRPPCRFELRDGVVFDVAHNLDGLKHLHEALQCHFPEKKFHLLLGLSKDKDVKAMIKYALENFAFVYFMQGSSSKSISQIELSSIASEISSSFCSQKTVLQVLEEVKELNHPLAVTGSFYLMEVVQKALKAL
jgi:dihydrofolate synthase/folylpolyglutamate synthase